MWQGLFLLQIMAILKTASKISRTVFSQTLKLSTAPLASKSETVTVPNKMTAWHLNSYKGIDNLELSKDSPVPIIAQANVSIHKPCL